MSHDPRRIKSKASPSRIKALEALQAIQKRNAFAHEVIAKIIDGSALDESDKAFATRLVLGVVSMQGTLDAVIDRCLRSPDDIQDDVRNALRISAYELLYLDKASYAAVDQGVELVRYIAPKASGLANAVLRKMVKAAAAFPFGNPDTDLEALALLEGFPPWLASLCLLWLGPARGRAFMKACNDPSPLFVFINSLKADEDEVRELFDGLGGYHDAPTLCGIVPPGCLRLNRSRAISDGRVRKLLSDGSILVSDASAQAVAFICAAAIARARKRKGSDVRVLELCSGRGTKTIMIQDDVFRLTGEQVGHYVCVDNMAFKNAIVEERIRHFGIKVRSCLTEDLTATPHPIEGGDYDVVFLDAPCSGLGTMRKHPEIRWRIRPEVIEQDAERDGKLLASAALNVASGGYLLYATCTITPDENERAVKSFLESSAGEGFRLVPIGEETVFRTSLAPDSPDAHFAALMQRVTD